MANRYIIDGATYNGDGTTSAEATVAGGVGAWNTINYTNPTTYPPAYGTLPTGTTVYIRSKTAAGADITVTLGANITIGLAGATEAAPVIWVLDNGVVWPWIDGALTYLASNTDWYCTIAANNVFAAMTKSALVFNKAKTTASYNTYVVLNNGTLKNALIDNSARTTASDGYVCAVSSSRVYDSCTFKLGAFSTISYPAFIAVQSGHNTAVLLNCDIELTSSAVVTRTGLFGFASYKDVGITMIGGRIFGVGSTAGNALANFGNATESAQFIRLIGVQYPAPPLLKVNISETPTQPFSVEMFGTDGNGTTGGHIENLQGFATSRTDNNPPARQALMPDGNDTAWAWRIWIPRASKMRPWIQAFTKSYSGTSAALVLELELLVSTVATPDKSTCWIDISYVDAATSAAMSVSTKSYAPDALTASGVTDWSAEEWGIIAFTKAKMSVTTPTTVKQNTIVTMTLSMTCGNVNANAVYFVDPDFTVL